MSLNVTQEWDPSFHCARTSNPLVVLRLRLITLGVVKKPVKCFIFFLVINSVV